MRFILPKYEFLLNVIGLMCRQLRVLHRSNVSPPESLTAYNEFMYIQPTHEALRHNTTIHERMVQTCFK